MRQGLPSGNDGGGETGAAGATVASRAVGRVGARHVVAAVHHTIATLAVKGAGRRAAIGWVGRCAAGSAGSAGRDVADQARATITRRRAPAPAGQANDAAVAGRRAETAQRPGGGGATLAQITTFGCGVARLTALPAASGIR